MCNAVSWPEHHVRFADREDQLPVVTHSSGIAMVCWGVHYDDRRHHCRRALPAFRFLIFPQSTAGGGGERMAST